METLLLAAKEAEALCRQHKGAIYALNHNWRYIEKFPGNDDRRMRVIDGYFHITEDLLRGVDA